MAVLNKNMTGCSHFAIARKSALTYGFVSLGQESIAPVAMLMHSDVFVLLLSLPPTVVRGMFVLQATASGESCKKEYSQTETRLANASASNLTEQSPSRCLPLCHSPARYESRLDMLLSYAG